MNFFHFRVLSLQYFPVFYKEEKCEAVVHRAKCNDVINTTTTAPILLAIIVVILIYSRHSLSMTANIVNNEWFDVIRASFSTCTQQQRDKLENNFNSGLTPVDNGQVVSLVFFLVLFVYGNSRQWALLHPP